MTDSNKKEHGKASMLLAFIENNLFLKRLLKKYLYCEHDIEDVVQEVYIKAVNADKLDEIRQPRAFLITIAKNLAINEIRRKSRKTTEYIEDAAMSIAQQELSASAELELEAEQSMQIHCEAIETLPEICKKVYLLRKVHGMKHKEISNHLGISLSSVEKHLRSSILNCEAYISRKNNISESKNEDSNSFNGTHHKIYGDSK
ncbi:RNA polymerase sigma factor [Thalassotalea sp. ND16A]|uniref:RNA polymerase sigma factor n=1 Tax=Thalassotalea sp. ND16A TaxID=1535422 RepID=UPI00051D0A2A|nr:RNA polymerase sigma factor [Thalassotalea sp. ND16A]KGK00088.1 RNA polymerase, sigma-24 subunit, ECF subfamily [Thalassotalea sp. ND16A]